MILMNSHGPDIQIFICVQFQAKYEIGKLILLDKNKRNQTTIFNLQSVMMFSG